MRKLKESLEKLSSNAFITDSPYQVKNLLQNKPKFYRILYDGKLDKYLIGDGNELINWDMIVEAKRRGHYAELADFIDELGGTLDNYVYVGVNGLWDVDDEEPIEPFLIYMVFIPKDSDEEFELGDDGYNYIYYTPYGTIFTRDIELEDCELFTVLKASTEPQKQESLKEDASKDYGTGEAVGDDIFDNKTHIPFYDKILTNPEEMEKTYNLKGEIVQMTPKEYYYECTAKIFPKETFDGLVRSREIDTKVTQEIEDVITKYKRRVFLPYINYADETQEGLHRMLVAANLFGWNHKFPVLVVDYADKERAEKDKRTKYENDLKIVLRDVLREASKYKYSSLDEFKENLPYIVDTKFEFYEYDTSTLKLTINNDNVIISVEGVEETMPTEDIKIVEKDDTDDIEWEDIDIDEDDLVDFDDFDSVISWLNKNGEN